MKLSTILILISPKPNVRNFTNHSSQTVLDSLKLYHLDFCKKVDIFENCYLGHGQLISQTIIFCIIKSIPTP